MNRRFLLKTFFMFPSFIIFGRLVANSTNSSDRFEYERLFASRLSRLYGKGVFSIGRNYIAQQGNQEVAANLLFSLPSELGKDIINLNDSDLQDRIQRVVKRDFEFNHLIVVDGWRLSATEVKISVFLSVMTELI